MTLGESIRAKLDALDTNHTDVAMEWTTRWTKRGGRSYKTDTVPSRLSELLADKLKGIRFFFNKRERAGILFDILGLDDDECSNLFALADKALANGGQRPPRLILDIEKWDGDRDQIDRVYQAIEDRFLKETKLHPLALVLTENQYRYLPRPWDDLGDDLVVCRVEDEEAASEEVENLASDHSTVLSPRRLVPYSRWIAAEFDGSGLRLDPTDAVQQLCARGSLAELPHVEHNLADIIDLPADNPLPTDSVELRKLMRDLSTEDGAVAIDEDAAVRLGWAQTLGIEASSTERERVDAEIQELVERLPQGVQVAEESELEWLLEAVHHEPVPAQILRVGDTLHGINIDLPEHHRIITHDVDWVPTPLRRLTDAIADWTDDDFLEDRLLFKVTEELDPDGRERAEFNEARSELLESGDISRRSPPLVGEWEAAMASLLRGDPPAARLRLRMELEREESNHSHVRLAGERGDIDGSRVPTVPAADLLLQRTDEVFAVIQSYHREWNIAPLAIPPELWEAADQELALVWLALQQALDRGEHVRIHDGLVLLRMEAGIMAKLKVWKWGAEDDEVRAAFLLPLLPWEKNVDLWSYRMSLEYLTDQVLIQKAHTTGYCEAHTTISFPLPRLISISGLGYRADVSFIASPLFLNAPTTSTFAMQAAAGANLFED